MSQAEEIQQRVILATSPDRLPTLTVPQLRKLYDSLCEVRQVRIRFGYTLSATDDLLQTLRQEIESKRAEEQGERHHEQVMSQGSNILYWTKCAVVAAVVIPILVALIAEIPFSRLLLSKPSRESPQPACAFPSFCCSQALCVQIALVPVERLGTRALYGSW